MLLTLVTALSGVTELNINKVNLELLSGLDTDQEGRTTTGSNDFIRVMLALEDEGK